MKQTHFTGKRIEHGFARIKYKDLKFIMQDSHQKSGYLPVLYSVDIVFSFFLKEVVIIKVIFKIIFY